MLLETNTHLRNSSHKRPHLVNGVVSAGPASLSPNPCPRTHSHLCCLPPPSSSVLFNLWTSEWCLRSYPSQSTHLPRCALIAYKSRWPLPPKSAQNSLLQGLPSSWIPGKSPSLFIVYGNLTPHAKSSIFLEKSVDGGWFSANIFIIWQKIYPRPFHSIHPFLQFVELISRVYNFRPTDRTLFLKVRIHITKSLKGEKKSL